jgi:P-type Ca2+ transporter type 2C
MVFMGTSVTMGRGGAVIVETGMRTQLGKIADMIQTVSSGPTPLQRRMARLGTSLAVVALFIVALVFGLGVLRGENPLEMALTGVAMAVAVVPEGLPAVVTIALALGAQRMLRRRALIRKLPAVETLGSVTTICSDKTGTLTENRMTVTLLDIAEQRVSLEQILRNERPVLRRGDVKPEPATATQAMLLAGGALCNDALLEPSEDVDGDFETIGDPTEAALVAAAARYGLWKNELEGSFPRVAEAPFTSERKLMSTVHGIPDGDSGLVVNPYMRQNLMAEGAQYLGITKGAIDQLLAISDRVWVKDRFERLDENWKQRLRDANAEMARDGLRVLGVAFRPLAELPGKEPEDIERELAIVGIIGMIDPPREEVKEAVAKCARPASDLS